MKNAAYINLLRDVRKLTEENFRLKGALEISRQERIKLRKENITLKKFMESAKR